MKIELHVLNDRTIKIVPLMLVLLAFSGLCHAHGGMLGIPGTLMLIGIFYIFSVIGPIIMLTIAFNLANTQPCKHPEIRLVTIIMSLLILIIIMHAAYRLINSPINLFIMLQAAYGFLLSIYMYFLYKNCSKNT